MATDILAKLHIYTAVVFYVRFQVFANNRSILTLGKNISHIVLNFKKLRIYNQFLSSKIFAILKIYCSKLFYRDLC